MRITFLTLIATTLLLGGCSKKAASQPEAAAAPGSDAKATTAPAFENPMIADGLEQLNKQIQQQQYDAAVGALVSMSQMPKSDKQQAQFMAKMKETETALLQKAQHGDAAAQQSAQMLGRMMTGR
jgi:PBP1b-binding outer membrane lipoprotein LpoB